ncbi:hypothetical protein IBX73_09115 [candidate division WOR-3 bacterium]|nr:hypothetical protein [candidate division WOR-3 bacterium]
MPKKRKTYICQLDQNEDEKAIDFELEFQRTLTTAERFKMMFDMSDRMKETLIKNGYRKPVEIITRS